MPVERDPGARRRGPRAAGRRRDGHRPLEPAVQAGHLRHRRRSRCRSRSATTPRSPASALARRTSSINGKVEVYNRCLDDGGTSNCLALDNFWRTLSNLTIHVNARRAGRLPRLGQLLGGLPGGRRCAGWTSRGGNLSLMDYCTAGPQFASGGFIADSRCRHRRQRLAAAVADAQQRGRRLVATASGTRSSPASSARRPRPASPNPPYTTLDTTPGQPREAVPVRRRRAARYTVRVPSAQPARAAPPGPTASTPGRTLPLADFFVARPGDSAKAINSPARPRQAPAAHPGRLRRRPQHGSSAPDTVVLGLGHATLTAVGGAVP